MWMKFEEGKRFIKNPGATKFCRRLRPLKRRGTCTERVRDVTLMKILVTGRPVWVQGLMSRTHRGPGGVTEGRVMHGIDELPLAKWQTCLMSEWSSRGGILLREAISIRPTRAGRFEIVELVGDVTKQQIRSLLRYIEGLVGPNRRSLTMSTMHVLEPGEVRGQIPNNALIGVPSRGARRQNLVLRYVGPGELSLAGLEVWMGLQCRCRPASRYVGVVLLC